MKTYLRNPNLILFLCAAVTLIATGCSSGRANPRQEAPPPTTVEPELDANNFRVDHPERFPLATAVSYQSSPSLNVTGAVQPDITRSVPVPSFASGRVVELKARLGDEVKKGQVLLRVQSNDVAGAYQNYLKAASNERLSKVQLDRAKILFDKGAVA